MGHYDDKLDSLRDLFGTEDVTIEAGALRVGTRRYPVVDDVVVLLDRSRWPASLAARLSWDHSAEPAGAGAFAPDIQHTFGEEWQAHPDVLPEHASEFGLYFDLVNLASLADRRVCDLGCGIGRWSLPLAGRCRELVLVDFSEAIFVARRNLAGAPRALFFMADLRDLPFRDDFAGFLFSLGVLHHLPSPALDEVRALRRWAPEILAFLYYALDNRPRAWRLLLRAVTALRLRASRVRGRRARALLTEAGTWGLYVPAILLGRALRPLGFASRIPLYDFYHDKSVARIRQDVYDRFFTRIEQRVSREEILGLKDAFREVIVSDRLPYWHFLCRR